MEWNSLVSFVSINVSGTLHPHANTMLECTLTQVCETFQTKRCRPILQWKLVRTSLLLIWVVIRPKCLWTELDRLSNYQGNKMRCSAELGDSRAWTTYNNRWNESLLAPTESFSTTNKNTTNSVNHGLLLCLCWQYYNVMSELASVQMVQRSESPVNTATH